MKDGVLALVPATLELGMRFRPRPRPTLYGEHPYTFECAAHVRGEDAAVCSQRCDLSVLLCSVQRSDMCAITAKPRPTRALRLPLRSSPSTICACVCVRRMS